MFQTPKRLFSIASRAAQLLPKGYMSPTRLFTRSPKPRARTEPPLLSDSDHALLFGAGGKPPRKSALGRNGSYHHSIYVERFDARRRYNSFLRKKRIYEAEKAAAGPSSTTFPTTSSSVQPPAFTVLQRQAQASVGDDPADPCDKIFLAQLAKLGAQPSNLDRFASIAAHHKDLEKERAIADRATREPSQARTQARRIRTTLEHEKRKEEFSKAMDSRHRRVAAELKQKVAGDRARNQRREEKELRRVEGLRKSRENRDRELIFQALRAGQPLTPELLTRNELITEVTNAIHEADRLKAQTRREEEQRRLAMQEQQRLERERLAKEREERERLRRADEMRQRKAWYDEAERRRREEEESARQLAREVEARRQAEARRQRLAEAEAHLRAQEHIRLQGEQARAEEQARAAEHARRTAQDAQPANPFELYDAKWKALKGAGAHSDIHFSAFPWPVFVAVTHPDHLTYNDIDLFLTHRGMEGKTPKEYLKAEILKWHPDKLAAQLRKVLPEHREMVREGGEFVAKVLNNFMEKF